MSDEIEHFRLLACCAFKNERCGTPTKSGQLIWPDVLNLHSVHRIRPEKSGAMFAGYELDGTRSNDNVQFRSILQCDIDTKGKKDESGRIVEVIEAAPKFENIRTAIDPFEYIAVSSHFHDPKRGVIKYRLVFLTDRDVGRDEYNFVLEALDLMLGGILDRQAWSWSQAFYLPSCPPETEADRFFEHNIGSVLPVDDFVLRGRALVGRISGAREASRLVEPPENEPSRARVLIDYDVVDGLGPPPVAEMRGLLEQLREVGFFKDRTGILRDASGRIRDLGWTKSECR